MLHLGAAIVSLPLIAYIQKEAELSQSAGDPIIFGMKCGASIQGVRPPALSRNDVWTATLHRLFQSGQSKLVNSGILDIVSPPTLHCRS